jgi:DNA-binding Lrp family transcriptional regulator
MYTSLEQKLLDNYQRNFPLGATPFADIADELGVSETQVLSAYKDLKARGSVGRIGGIFKPGSVGASTLAAMEVPQERLEAVAELVSSLATVNHNYEREHRLNLWFVVAADTQDDVANTLRTIEEQTGLEVLDLPMLEAFHLDLGFKLQWA